MVFLDEASEHQRTSRKSACLELVMEKHPKDAQEVRESVWGTRTSDVSRVALSYVLSQHGIKFSSKQMQRHLSSDCSCDQTLTGPSV